MKINNWKPYRDWTGEDLRQVQENSNLGAYGIKFVPVVYYSYEVGRVVFTVYSGLCKLSEQEIADYGDAVSSQVAQAIFPYQMNQCKALGISYLERN